MKYKPVLTATVIILTLLSIGVVLAYDPAVLNDPVVYPLPSLPDPVADGVLTVQVEAGASATGWEATISNSYDEYTCQLSSSSHDGDKWTLEFDVPTEIKPGLFIV